MAPKPLQNNIATGVTNKTQQLGQGLQERKPLGRTYRKSPLRGQPRASGDKKEGPEALGGVYSAPTPSPRVGRWLSVW